MRFTAHMAILGGNHRANSLAAIRECFEAGIERIEIDIHSLDGADYAVYHDRRLESHTSGNGSIGRANPEEIRNARFSDAPDDRVPLLSEVAAMATGARTELQLDLKDWRALTDNRARALIDAVAPIRDRVIVSTGQDWNLRRLYTADPELAIGFDPAHYLDHAVEEQPPFLPRTMSAYGYRDDHPLAYGRTEATADYLRERFEMLVMHAPAAREWFINYRLALQMLDDGFNAASWLHQLSIAANVWTLDYRSEESLTALRRITEARFDRITTNTLPAWLETIT